MFAVRQLPIPLLVVVGVDYHLRTDCSPLAHLFLVHFALHSERPDPTSTVRQSRAYTQAHAPNQIATIINSSNNKREWNCIIKWSNTTSGCGWMWAILEWANHCKWDTYGKGIIDRWFTKWVIFEARHIIRHFRFFVLQLTTTPHSRSHTTHTVFSIRFSLLKCRRFFFSLQINSQFAIDRMQCNLLASNSSPREIQFLSITRFTNSVTSSMNTTTIAIIFYMWVFSTAFCHDSSPNGDYCDFYNLMETFSIGYVQLSFARVCECFVACEQWTTVVDEIATHRIGSGRTCRMLHYRRVKRREIRIPFLATCDENATASEFSRVENILRKFAETVKKRIVRREMDFWFHIFLPGAKARNVTWVGRCRQSINFCSQLFGAQTP